MNERPVSRRGDRLGDIESYIAEGMIFFLNGSDYVSSRTTMEWNIDRGVLGHPVLILDIASRSAHVCIVGADACQNLHDL